MTTVPSRYLSGNPGGYYVIEFSDAGNPTRLVLESDLFDILEQLDEEGFSCFRANGDIVQTLIVDPDEGTHYALYSHILGSKKAAEVLPVLPRYLAQRGIAYATLPDPTNLSHMVLLNEAAKEHHG